jgi:hypothetical protein
MVAAETCVVSLSLAAKRILCQDEICKTCGGSDDRCEHPSASDAPDRHLLHELPDNSAQCAKHGQAAIERARLSPAQMVDRYVGHG